MARLVECIPNFSLSREKDEAGYEALVETAKSVPGCVLFDAQTDGNHNRSVLTLLGSPEAVEEAAFRLTKKAAELIDMNRAAMWVFLRSLITIPTDWLLCLARLDAMIFG